MSRASRALKRLRTMDAAELRFRALASARRQAARLGRFGRRPAWRRQSLAESLSDAQPLLRAAAACLASADWARAHTLLAAHFAGRPARFVLDPRQREALGRAIRSRFPGAVDDAVQRAREIAAGRFEALGYRSLSFPSGHDMRLAHGSPADIDWHLDPIHERRAPRVYWTKVPYLSPSCGDHKIIWELNRHQHWLALGRAFWLSGDERHRETFARQLSCWMDANPPLIGINWASMLELALRSLSWIWAIHFFVSTDAGADSSPAAEPHPWMVDLLLGLDCQLALVERNLSIYTSPNTHLLGEALALYVAGRALPELRRAGAWERIGRTILIEQISRQINADGGHVELSPHYHRYALDFYLLALAVARTTNDTAASRFADAACRLALFARVLADSAGRLPRIGDDDGGALFPICGRDCADATDSLALAAHLLDRSDLAVGCAEEVVWIAGDRPCSAPASPAWSSTALPASGYYVCRSRRGDHLVVDAGPHGFLNGGHAHADALSLTLTVAGRPLLIDPGTGCYTVDPEIRDRFRSSRLHNTLTIDGRSQSQPDGPFHWSSTATGTLHAWRSNAAFDFFDGSHDGYRPLVHRRTILARPGCWLVFDRVLGAGAHRADLHWHMDPSWEVASVGTGRVRSDHPSGARVWILSHQAAFEVFAGARGSADLGWCAPAYGPLVPTVTLRTTRQGDPPFLFVTVIVESRENPTFDRLALIEDSRAAGLEAAFRLGTRQWTETVLLAGASEIGSYCSASPVRSAGGIETDAMLLCWRQYDDGSDEVSLIDGSFVRRVDEGPVFELAHAVSDLGIARRADGRSSITSSRPIAGPSRTGVEDAWAMPATASAAASN